jgi:hypothetical protein
MAGRPKQPPCPKCGKALYKRPDAGSVNTTDPYGWCRNTSCETFGTDQSGASRFDKKAASKKGQQELFKKGAEAKPKAKSKPEAPEVETTNKKSKTVVEEVKEAIEDVPELVDEDDIDDEQESDALQVARKRIRQIMEVVEQTHGKHLIALALAILSQDTGSHSAANAFIREYGLDKKYGIKECDANGKTAAQKSKS